MTKTNMTIKIYRSDIEKIKSQLERRMSDVWDIYYSESQRDEEYAYAATSANEVWEELVRTKCLCNKADNLLADESFDFIYVDADEWFDEWYFEELIKDGLIDEYYMFPNSDEVFEKMKSEYKYSMTDLFGFFRFCAVNKDTAIA